MRQPQSRNWSGVSHSAEQQEEAVGGEEADRRAELRHHAEAAAPARRGILDREQRRAAPFAAEAEALAEAQQAEQRRRDPAGHRVGRQEGDRGGRSAHQQQRGDQRRLAPDPIAEMAEERAAERPRDEGEAEAGIGCEQLRRGRRAGEEERPEHQAGGGRVDVEIVELDRRADEAGEQHAANGVPARPRLAHRHHAPATGFSACDHALSRGGRGVNRMERGQP